ncbi:ABC transporter permease [Nonomuraea soli]|uniref:ABC-2 type transport system permease protein n=1 Tax=Nonomuraea soli TaxID=1032476 RepID=A0A7W0HP97_9ACTN|nr:ABC transporter permease [Nonomuraea soli]MBA2890527.1 ABC-2 type transport system permease protein [Nonomuraea soli]
MSSLVLAHTRVQFIEQLRVPIGLVAGAFFPAAAFLAFVVPNVSDPAFALGATCAMVVFAVMSTGMIGLGINVAQDRELPWDPYLRTLPAGPYPRIAGRVLTAMAISLLAMIPVVVLAALFTGATLSPPRLLFGLLAVLVITIPFMLIGLFIGFLLPAKAAIGVSQILFFPIAILGGLLGNPMAMPAFIEAVSPYMPSRGALELLWWAVMGIEVNWLAIGMLGVWTVVLALATAWAYRRDEGRRFS